jgi:uncharacterized protein
MNRLTEGTGFSTIAAVRPQGRNWSRRKDKRYSVVYLFWWSFWIGGGKKKTMGWHTVLLVGVGLLGGLLGYVSRVQAGTLMGAMLAVILFRMWGSGSQSLPWGFKFATQAMLGILLGFTFRREMLAELQRIWFPMLLSALILILVGLVIGYMLVRLKLMDTSTAYLSTSPGGMSALTALALESKASPPVVVLFHFFRVVVIVFSAPLVLRLLRLLS